MKFVHSTVKHITRTQSTSPQEFKMLAQFLYGFHLFDIALSGLGKEINLDPRQGTGEWFMCNTCSMKRGQGRLLSPPKKKIVRSAKK